MQLKYAFLELINILGSWKPLKKINLFIKTNHKTMLILRHPLITSTLLIIKFDHKPEFSLINGKTVNIKYLIIFQILSKVRQTSLHIDPDYCENFSRLDRL